MKTFGLKFLFSLVLGSAFLCSAAYADEAPSAQGTVVPASEDTKKLSPLSRVFQYPFTYLQLKEVFLEPSVLRKTVDPEDEVYMRLVDGSVWRIEVCDALYYDVFQKWKSHHLLTVGVSNDASYPLTLHNQNLNQKVKAALKTLGEESREAMLRVAGCTANHYVKLENGTYWDVAEKAFAHVQETWKAGDVIIVGPTEKWMSRVLYPSVLINVTRNDACYAAWLRY